MITRKMNLILLLTTAMIAVTPQARAAGALVIGMKNGDRSLGTAVGYGINYQNEGEAKYAALVHCLNTTAEGIPNEVVAMCRLATTFNNACFAVAWDPGGKPGWGWSVNADQNRAKQSAISQCSVRAGTTSNGCKVALSECDTTGSGSPNVAQLSSKIAPANNSTVPSGSGGKNGDNAANFTKP